MDYLEAVCLLKEEHFNIHRLIAKEKETLTIDDKLVDAATAGEEEGKPVETTDMDFIGDNDELYTFEPETKKKMILLLWKHCTRDLICLWMSGRKVISYPMTACLVKVKALKG